MEKGRGGGRKGLEENERKICTDRNHTTAFLLERKERKEKNLNYFHWKERGEKGKKKGKKIDENDRRGRKD